MYPNNRNRVSARRQPKLPPIRTVYANALLAELDKGGVKGALVDRLLHVLRLAGQRGSGLDRQHQAEAQEFHDRLATLTAQVGAFAVFLRDGKLPHCGADIAATGELASAMARLGYDGEVPA